MPWISARGSRCVCVSVKNVPAVFYFVWMLHQIHTCIIKWVLFCHPMKLVVAIKLEISSRMLPQCLSAKRRSWRWWTLWAYCDDKRSSGLIISWHSNIRTFSSKGTISITGNVNNYNQGLKLSFCQTCQWPVTSSNLPGKIFLLPAINNFFKNRQVITTTITKHITKVLISPLLTRIFFCYWFLFFWSLKYIEILVPQTEQAIVLRLSYTYSVCSLNVVQIISTPILMDWSRAMQ